MRQTLSTVQHLMSRTVLFHHHGLTGVTTTAMVTICDPIFDAWTLSVGSFSIVGGNFPRFDIITFVVVIEQERSRWVDDERYIVTRATRQSVEVTIKLPEEAKARQSNNVESSKGWRKIVLRET